jgi:hypothetical protein
MNEDFGKATDSILKIMENVSALKTKIEKEESRQVPDQKKLLSWKRELLKANRALDKRRTMA